MNTFKLKRQLGMTLIELMVAMVISLLLIAGTITIFMSNKQAYRLNDASSRVQESGRFAFDFLKRDVRMAGFVGCVSKNLATSFNNLVDTSKYDASTEGDIQHVLAGFNGLNTVQGYTIPDTGLSVTDDLYKSGLRNGSLEGNVVAGNDAIVVTLGGSCDGGAVTQPMPFQAANIKIVDATSCGINQYSVVMVSDCEAADMFRVTNNPASGADKDTLAHTVNLNTDNNLSKSYGTDAEVFRLTTHVYYIGRNADGGPSLFRRHYSGAAGTMINEELVEGVESMIVLYGVDTDSDSSANYYVNANDVPANRWPNVTSVRIQVVVRSQEQNVVQSTAVSDRRLRHTFSETIKIRNRI